MQGVGGHSGHPQVLLALLTVRCKQLPTFLWELSLTDSLC